MLSRSRQIQILPVVVFFLLASRLLGGNVPYLVKDINPFAGSSPMELTKVGDRLFFSANDGVHGRELWVSDGTAAGTYLVTDVWPGPDWSDPVALTEAGGKLYFQARNAAGDLDLYVSDGTAQGTFFLINLSDGTFYHQMASLNGMLLFQREVPPNQTRQLWRTSGTPASTAFVKEVRINHMGKVGSLLYFAGVGPGAVIPGFDLWKTDGTTAGTQMLADLEGCIWIHDFNGQAIFRGDFSPEGREPWMSDGTPQGTRLLKDINPGSMWSDPAGFTLLKDIILFDAFLGSDLELWRTDGSDVGTFQVKDINPSGSAGASELTVLHDLAIFRSFRPDIGIELWKTDGTENGTVLVKDIRPGPDDSRPEMFVLANGKLYFRADDGVHGKEMWVTDGTADGTLLVSDLNPGPSTGFTQETPVNVGGLLLFTVSNPITGGAELWGLDTNPAQIPTASTWSLLILMLLLGSAGSIIVLQRHD